MARNKIEINLKNNLNQILSERKIQKMELAKRLLLYSSFSIKEIAAHLAFSDQYYFSNFFKMKTGLSPRTYKMKYLGKRKKE